MRTYLVKCIEFRPRTQSLRILSKENLGSGSRIDDKNRDVTQLDLENRTVPFGPYAILLSSIFADLREIAN